MDAFPARPFRRTMVESHLTPETTSVLFVCLGNICRSPLAEGVFLHLVRTAGKEEHYRIDSAGTGDWHVGESPDSRSIEVALRHGIELAGSARQVRPEDFHTFDRIVAMDRDNLRDLRRIADGTGGKGVLSLLREFDPEADGDLSVPDPYYGGPDGFERMFVMVHRSCVRLLASLDAVPSE
jgi:protein-tyrosine phosphatase